MIKLYREEHSVAADAIEAEFRELVLGYDRVVIESRDATVLFGADTSLPVITNNTRIVSGASIPAYIEELTRVMRAWQLFQSDACYVDENGETC